MFETSGRPEGTKAEIYEELARQASGLFHGERDAIANAANLAALIAWGLADLNWAGFYIQRGDELVLGPFVGKPACVRIAPGRGVCGTAAAERRSVLVEDVHAFPGHIACDSRSASEIVVPVKDASGALIAVFDVDATTKAAFDATDAQALERLMGKVFAAG